jgi:four helix bundle protein
LFECVAVVDILKDSGRISEFEFEQTIKEADELSRILYAMIKNLT